MEVQIKIQCENEMNSFLLIKNVDQNDEGCCWFRIESENNVLDVEVKIEDVKLALRKLSAK